LIEHLPDVIEDKTAHCLVPRAPTEHAIELAADSRLAGIYQETHFSAASWHHQAIGDVAPGLTIVGRAPDGTIEALEMADHPELIAVQWHPELTAATDPIQQRIFSTFIEICRQQIQD